MEYDFDLSVFDEKETPKIKNTIKKIVFKDIIIFENDDYILINKPPYISSLDERTQDKRTGGTPQSILRLAKEYSGDAQLCHRLDKETSGVLAIAKKPAAAGCDQGMWPPKGPAFCGGHVNLPCA